jgi:hypothetical protein
MMVNTSTSPEIKLPEQISEEKISFPSTENINEIVLFYNLYRKFISSIDTRGQILVENMCAEQRPFQLKRLFS